MSKINVTDLKPQHEFLKEKILAAVEEVLSSTQFIMGSQTTRLENEIADYLNVSYAVGVNSGTDALVISLRAAGLMPGDEVITTPFSFFATAEAISAIGARPVFCDIDIGSYNIDAGKIREKITEKTKAIVPVHLFGAPADMDEIMVIAGENDLKVVEDCAQSFGARYFNPHSKYHNKHTGTIGAAGAFSFFPTKNLGACGDGGMIATNDEKIAVEAKKLRSHGSIRKYENEILGYNSRLDSIQAAILRVKLPYIDGWNSSRRNAALKYSNYLSGIDGLRLPKISEGHVFHQYSIRITDGNRNTFKLRLDEEGISTMVYYPVPIDMLPVYMNQYPPNPNSERLAEEILSLPLWPEIEEETIAYIAEKIKVILENMAG